MPEVSRFLGIVITMYFADHVPPHFHAKYGSDKAEITIRDFLILKGELPSRIFGLVVEWAKDHREELMEDWDLARQQSKLKRIKPLV